MKSSLTSEEHRELIIDGAVAVVFDDDKSIALLHIASVQLYKFFGVDFDENKEIEKVLTRSLQEETGCKTEIVADLGTTKEHQYFWNQDQLTHNYMARVVGEKGEPHFTERELSEGYEIVWAKNIGDAIRLLENSGKGLPSDTPASISISSVRTKDLALAKKAKQYLLS